MIRDPLYSSILERLGEHLDADVFEQTVCDLLRTDYPGLAVVKGGSDAGMDGAIGSSGLPLIPVVITTAHNVLDNLTRNLKMFMSKGWRSRSVVFVTSKALTPQRRQNLYARAEELGFNLVNVHDQTDLAQRLYRSPAWCRDLLGLVGNPPALSVFPLSLRPYGDQLITGRDADLDWLRGLDGDGLLVGQPGSGKTYLLHRLAKDESFGLFAVTSDRTALANGIREHEPRFIIVDDAQLASQQDLIQQLVHLRAELGANFRVLAAIWPTEAKRVADLMSLTLHQVRELDRLTRNQVVEVVKSMGVIGPNWLVREIVNQAEGLPGLATALAHACKVDGVERVVRGDALVQMIDRLADLLGDLAKPILAALSIGGASGMSTEVVAALLGVSPIQLSTTTALLASGGIVMDRGATVSVQPAALRRALIRDEFFRGGTSLPRPLFERLVAQAPSRTHAARSVLGARYVGADIPLDFVTSLVEETGLWREFAQTGRGAVDWIISNRPERIPSVAVEALEDAPTQALAHLLRVARADDGPLHSNPSLPLRQILDWVRDPRSQLTLIEKRTHVLRAAQGFLEAGGDVTVASQCIPIIFDPTVETDDLDPGAGNTFIVGRGALTAEDCEKLGSQWRSVLELFDPAAVASWQPALEAVRRWFFSDLPVGGAELHAIVRSLGRAMLLDLADWAHERPEVIHQLKQLVAQGEFTGASLPNNELLEALFPVRSRAFWEDWEAESAASVTKTRTLAATWSDLSDDELLSRLIELSAQEDSLGPGWHSYSNVFCYELAKETDRPADVAMRLVERGARPAYVAPFLQVAVGLRAPGWDQVFRSCIKNRLYVGIAFHISLGVPDLPAEIWEEVLEALPQHPSVIAHALWQSSAEPTRLASLLNHADPSVSANTVTDLSGLYWQDTMAHEVRPIWETAFVRTAHLLDQYIVETSVEGRGYLAEGWLEQVILDPDRFMVRMLRFDEEELIATAVRAVDRSARQRLIERIPEGYGLDGLVQHLVGDDTELYSLLLQQDRLAHYHLAPLSRIKPTETWMAFSEQAARRYGADEIAQVLQGMWSSWLGSEAAYWQRRIDDLQPLLAHTDPVVIEAVQLAIEAFSASRDRATEHERREAVFGREASRY